MRRAPILDETIAAHSIASAQNRWTQTSVRAIRATMIRASDILAAASEGGAPHPIRLRRRYMRALAARM